MGWQVNLGTSAYGKSHTSCGLAKVELHTRKHLSLRSKIIEQELVEDWKVDREMNDFDPLCSSLTLR